MNSLFSVRAFLAATAIAAMSFGSVNADEVSKASAVSKARPVARAVASTPSIRPLSISLELLTNTRLSGTLTDTTTLDMRTSFGTASIPLSEVAGIKFASADDASTTVVMLNGDSITGATDVKLVTVETEWGVATVNGSTISSMMFVPGLSWNPSAGLNGKRWSLVNAKARAAVEAKETTVAAPATSTRSVNNSPYHNVPRSSQGYRSR